jgi:hypothetical protein
VLKYFFGSDWADAWKRVLTGKPFHYKGETYVYNTGQPMGGYSSWPVFALCHHLIILVSA